MIFNDLDLFIPNPFWWKHSGWVVLPHWLFPIALWRILYCKDTPYRKYNTNPSCKKKRVGVCLFVFIWNQGSIVTMNLYSMHNDETYWKDPQVFRPERHLDSDGKIIKSDHFLPFGAGKATPTRNVWMPLHCRVCRQTDVFGGIFGQERLLSLYNGLDEIIQNRKGIGPASSHFGPHQRVHFGLPGIHMRGDF